MLIFLYTGTKIVFIISKRFVGKQEAYGTRSLTWDTVSINKQILFKAIKMILP